MSTLFGVDVGQIVGDVFKGQTKVAEARRPQNAAPLSNSVKDILDQQIDNINSVAPHPYRFEGFIYEAKNEYEQGHLNTKGRTRVLIFERLVSGLGIMGRPMIGDQFTMDGESYELGELIERDSFQAALIFEAKVKSGPLSTIIPTPIPTPTGPQFFTNYFTEYFA